MRDNLIFYNIPESEAAEDRDGPKKLISNVIKEKLGIQEKVHFERAHRMGARGNADGSPKIRPIVAKFSSHRQKENVKGEGAKLKGTNIGMSEQFPKEIQERRKELWAVFKEAKHQGHRVKIVVDRLFIDGVEYKQWGVVEVIRMINIQTFW